MGTIKLEKEIRNCYNTEKEMKIYDNYISTSISNNTLSGSSSISSPLFAPIQGTDVSERIGTKVNVFKMEINGSIQVNMNPIGLLPGSENTIATPWEVLRLVFFWNKQCNGVTAGSLVLNTGTGCDVYSFPNEKYLDRFTIVQDFIFDISNIPCFTVVTATPLATAQNFNCGTAIGFRFTKTYPTEGGGIPVEFYTGVNGTTLSILRNSFECIACRGNTVDVNRITTVTVRAGLRFWFKDDV